MEPHMNHEDEISVDDTKITPENVKTSTISKDYKALMKLLLKSTSTNNTVRLLSTCLELRVLPKSFQLNTQSQNVQVYLNVEQKAEFERSKLNISIHLLQNALEQVRKRKEENMRNFRREKKSFSSQN